MMVPTESMEDQNLSENKHYNIAFSYRPVHILLSLFGLSKFAYVKNKTSNLGKLSLIWAISLGILNVSLTFITNKIKIDKTLNSKRHLPAVTYIIHVLLMLSISVTSVFSIFASIFAGKQYSTMINNFQTIDVKLNIRGRKEYTDLKFTLFCFELCVLLNSLAKVINHYVHRVEELNMLMLYVYSFEFFIVLQMLDFICIFWIAITRFEKLNIGMESLLNDVNDANKTESSSNKLFRNDFHTISRVLENRAKEFDNSGVPSSKLLKGGLLVYMKLFGLLADNIFIINNVFGTSLIFATISLFLHILATMNGLILINKIIEFYVNYTSFIFLVDLIPLGSIYVFGVYLAEKLNEKLARLSSTIDKLTTQPSVGEIELELLECFSQIVTGRDVFITAKYYFIYDFNFLCTLLGNVATYSIILLQVSSKKN